MATPTRYQTWTQPLLVNRLGFAEQPEPDPDPEDPVDYAAADEAGAVFTPYQIGGGAVTLVDSYRAVGSSEELSWAGNVAPTLGNVLLVFAFRRNAGSHAAPTGWTQLVRVGPTGTTGSDVSVTAYAKVSDGTETEMDYAGGTADFVVMEISGVTLADIETNSNSSAGFLPSPTMVVTTGSVTPTAGVQAIIIGANAIAPDEVLGHDETPGGGWTELYDPIGTGSPFGGGVVYQIANPTSGSYNPTTTATTSGGDKWRGVTVSLAASVAYDWTPAPAINDGDDATYVQTDVDVSGEALRAVLEVERLIYRAELRVGTDGAGSRTYDLYGTDDPLFVDAPTLLDSVTFTATGTFTAQEVVFTWLPATPFQYYRLFIDTSEEIRWYDLNLYSAVGTVGVTEHGALNGRDDPDQHAADAVSYDNSTSGLTATDVQAAIDEVVAGGGGGGVTVEDEGTPLATTATTLDFVGAGVTASGSGATKTITIPGGGGTVGAYDIERRTAGDLTISSTSAGAAVPTIGNCVVAASAGDLLLIGLSTTVTVTANSAMRMDAATIVSGSPVNYVSSLSGTPATVGLSVWRTPISGEGRPGAAVPYVVQSGDISGGTVTISLRAWLSSATSKDMGATTASPFIFWVKNLLQ